MNLEVLCVNLRQRGLESTVYKAAQACCWSFFHPFLSLEPTKQMTLQERLQLGGLSAEFDKSAASGDKAKLREILKKINFSPEEIDSILAWFDG